MSGKGAQRVALYNRTQNTPIPVRILHANRFLSRLTGLQGMPDWESDHGVFFSACRSIHTFGMQFPLDVLFLDKNGNLLERVQNFGPNRVCKGPKYTRCVLEFRTGFLNQIPLRIGDVLEVETDGVHRPGSGALTGLLHWPSNFLIALIWGRFAWSSFSAWALMPTLINLGLFLHNTLLMALFLTRRRSKESSGKMMDWLIPFLTLICTLGLRPTQDSGSWMPVSILVQIVGVGCMILSLASLGRSFGIVPSNRSIKVSGAYHLIRHPLYLSELIFYTGFLLASGSIRNMILILMILFGQIWRASREEQLLSRDPAYLKYLTSVRYRFIPGLY